MIKNYKDKDLREDEHGFSLILLFHSHDVKRQVNSTQGRS